MLKSYDRKKVESYIIENKNSFYRIAYSYTKNKEDALDVVQDSIYKALCSIDTIQDIKCIKTWFYKILIRTSIDNVRKNARYTNLISTELTVDQGGVYDRYTDIDLRKALDELPIEYKSIILLRFFEDLKIDEVAEILDENINTVKTRLYTALKKLKYNIKK